MPDTARNVIPSEAPALGAVKGAQITLEGKTLHTGKSTSEFLKGERQVPEKMQKRL